MLGGALLNTRALSSLPAPARRIVPLVGTPLACSASSSSAAIAASIRASPFVAAPAFTRSLSSSSLQSSSPSSSFSSRKSSVFGSSFSKPGFITPSIDRLQTRNFASSPSSLSSTNNTMANAFLEAVRGRHSNYALKDTGLPIDDARIEEIVKTTILNAPSSFNAQSTRLVVLLKAEHKKFWDYVLEVLQPHIKPETKAHTEGRINGFKAGYGTILFFEDPDPTNELKKKFPQYEDRFEPWSEHTSAIHQYILWTAFSAEGLGANLQHYNPLIDTKAKDEWKVPGAWSLKAQLVFGALAGEPAGEKEKLPVDKTVFVHGK